MFCFIPQMKQTERILSFSQQQVQNKLMTVWPITLAAMVTGTQTPVSI